MKSTAEVLVTAIVVLCAVTSTALLVRREFITPPAAQAEPKPRFSEEWRKELAVGVRMGPADAPVQILEFADFQCPFCAKSHDVLKELRQKHPTQVAVIYAHFPLEMHPFAQAAARAAECAAAQGRFEQMHDRLFENQKDFGRVSWSQLAESAGVADSPRFDACMNDPNAPPRIASGTALGNKLDIRGTPTMIVNGWQFSQPPALDELENMVTAVLAGKSPVGT